MASLLDSILPTQEELLASLSPDVKELLYRHFEASNDPDKLIYIAWMYANGWLSETTLPISKNTDPKTGETFYLETIDLDKPGLNTPLLYQTWKMELVINLLRD